MQKGVIMLASANITFRTDEEVKKVAGEVFGEMGMDMTTGLNIYLRMVARDRKIPFEVAVNEPDEEYKKYIREELAKRKEKAKDPDTKWYSLDEVAEMFGVNGL